MNLDAQQGIQAIMDMLDEDGPQMSAVDTAACVTQHIPTGGPRRRRRRTAQRLLCGRCDPAAAGARL